MHAKSSEQVPLGSGRGKRLAEQFTEANDALLRLLQRATPAQWRQRTSDEGELRSIGVIAYHVAWGHTHINRRVAAFAHGTEVPARRPELFDERNARQARENPNPDQAETLALLRQNGAAVAAMIAGLTDEQLDRTAREDPGAPLMTTAEVIEQRQIGHMRAHLATTRATLAEEP